MKNKSVPICSFCFVGKPMAPLATCFMLVSALKVEVTCSSKMLADIQQTALRYIPEHRTLLQTFLFITSVSLSINFPSFHNTVKMCKCLSEVKRYKAKHDNVVLRQNHIL